MKLKTFKKSILAIAAYQLLILPSANAGLWDSLWGNSTNDNRQSVANQYADVIPDLLDQAERLGAPMRTVQIALEEMRRSVYKRKDVFSVFDLSQHSSRKRFYLFDLRNGVVESFYASHGEGNGPMGKAKYFRDFNDSRNKKTPLGALVTFDKGFPYPGYETVYDSVYKKTYRNLLILDLEGTKPYNDNINSHGAQVVFHSKKYATRGFRRRNGGKMGRSWGCIVIDPTQINYVIDKVRGGSLVYVSVGNRPVEDFIY